jgi:murein DD-endopeptidase MepM/ murein hydrolase activator NlpD
MRRPAAALAAPPALDATGAGHRRVRGLEIQIHPSDIRRRVIYLFIGRAELTLWCLAGLVYVLFLTVALAFAPGVVRGLLSSSEYQGRVAERVQQGERLQALVGQVADLAERSRALGVQAAKVRLAYGLGNPPAPPPRPPRSAPPAAPSPAADSIYADAIQQGDHLRGRIEGDLALLAGRLTEVESFERAHPDLVATTPAACPLKGEGFVLISSFARRRNPFTHALEFHAGLDLAANSGTPVYAPADGTVAFAGQLPPGRHGSWWRLGNLVLLADGDRFYTAFGHLGEIRVRRGERVRRGAVLGTVGSSGWSTSPHLYYEIRRRDPGGIGDRGDRGDYRPVDPRTYILNHRWPNEERLLLGAASGPRPGEYDPLPGR